MKVYANQPCFVTWTTDSDGNGWSLVIFPIEMSAPDGKPAEFRCSWVPTSLIDIVVRTSPDQPSSARDKVYAEGYYPNWHTLEVPDYPEDTRPNLCNYSHDPNQDFAFFLLHPDYDAPFDFIVPSDYIEHLTPTNIRFDIWVQQRAVWVDKQFYVQVKKPTDYICSSFECVLNDHLLERHIPRTVIVHRHYLKGLPQGTRNPRARDGDIWSHPGHTANFIHWMARHPPGSTEFDYNLENARTDAAVNAMLDNPDWRRCHLPETLSWVHSTSITLICDIYIYIYIYI